MKIQQDIKGVMDGVMSMFTGVTSEQKAADYYRNYAGGYADQDYQVAADSAYAPERGFDQYGGEEANSNLLTSPFDVPGKPPVSSKNVNISAMEDRH